MRFLRDKGGNIFLPKVFLAGLFVLWALLNCGALALATTAPHTGQDKCFDNNGEIDCPQPGEPFYGQDGHHKGPRSFTKLGQAGLPLADAAPDWLMVRDNTTGLVWEKKQNADGVAAYNNPNDTDNTYAWYNSALPEEGGERGIWSNGVNTQVFINALNNASYGGFSDWRLPTLAELATLVISDGSHPAVNGDYFPGTASGRYWSSTTYAEDNQDDKSKAWRVRFGNPADPTSAGNILEEAKASLLFVRAVRGNMDPHNGTFMENNDVPIADRTVTNTASGLMWWDPFEADEEINPGVPTNEEAKAQLNTKRTWQEALAFCREVAAAGYAGYTDWRMPNRNEMQSLLNYGAVPLSDVNVFTMPTEQNSRFWSSTTNSAVPGQAWRVNVDYGQVQSTLKTEAYFVRPVRGGYSGPLAPEAVISPTQADSWQKGQVMPIVWQVGPEAFDAPQNPSDDDPKILIFLSRDGGRTFSRLNTRPSPNTGAWAWTVAGDVTYSAMLRIAQQRNAQDTTGDPDKWVQVGLFAIINAPDNTPAPKRQVTGGATDSGGGGCFLQGLQP
jgi:hypothetical protein